MAKRKKSRAQYVSKGVVGHPKRCRNRDPLTRLMNQQKAWLAGKNVVLTIANPDTTCTNARFIKVNARDHWGLPPMLKRKETNAS